jgi:TRAP-type mannitol/chloroaromatic compound transport system permease large subunit
MDIITAFLLIALLIAILASGFWIGLALLGVAVFSMEVFTSRPVGDSMVFTIWGSTSSWTLTALPLFLWMGEILFRSRLTADLFTGLAPWLNRLPGRLLHANVVGCGIFAAVSGSSAATCATIGKITLPELKKRGYPDAISMGTGRRGHLRPADSAVDHHDRLRGGHRCLDRQAVCGRRAAGHRADGHLQRLSDPLGAAPTLTRFRPPMRR